MTKYITLYEGECERSIIEWLKQKDYVFGRTIKQVLSEIKKIDRVLHMINAQSVVTIVMDCDTLHLPHVDISRLKVNIEWLTQQSKKVRIITQNSNLEDELIKGLNLRNEVALFRHFNANNRDTYKRNLANLAHEKLDIKLEGLDYERFWSEKVLDRYPLLVLYSNYNCILRDIKN